MNNRIVRTSKFLSFVLRHKPGEIGISLDNNGWVDIDLLIDAANKSSGGDKLTRQLIEEVVNTNDKQRFSISVDGGSIRANQGHSVSVNLELAAKTPPHYLYHGTIGKFFISIETNGLQKMNRQHVHLSDNIETATTVASRRGKPLILIVNTKNMLENGFEFYQSDNGVWLTDSVPYKYIEIYLTN